MVVNVQVYCSFIGNTGWNNHVRDFLSSLDHSILNVKVTNFTVDDDFKSLDTSNPFDHLEYITDTHRNILHEQLLWNDNGTLERFPIYSYEEDFVPDVNLVFAEVDHYLYYQDFYDNNIPKIAYTVWETTKLPDNFYNKLQEFDELWVPTKWQKDCHIEQGYQEHKLKVVNEGVNSDLFIPKKINRNKLMKFLVVGRWDYRKSTEDIIRTWINTFDKNENVELVLSVDNFDNPQDKYKSTKERLEAYKLQDNRISIVSYTDRNTYINRLKTSDVLLSCSRGEGWNLPLIESMACGTPAIYSKCSGQLEYTEDSDLGVDIKQETNAWKSDIGNLYEPDFEDLSRVMKLVYDNYDNYKKQALKLSDRIRRDYDWSICGKLGTSYLTRIRKYSDEINPTYVTHVNPHENLESINDSWIPKIDRYEGKFMTTKTDWEDVFICHGKDASFWGRGSQDSYTGGISGFRILMRDDIFPHYHIGNSELEMRVKFYDMDAENPDKVVSSNLIRPGWWVESVYHYFVRWRVTVEDVQTGTIYFEYKLDSLKGMDVLFHSIKGLGDTLAWFPYVEEFRKKHDCNVYYAGGYHYWLRENYPNINFIEDGEEQPKCHLGYEIGWIGMEHDPKVSLKVYEPMDYDFPLRNAPRNYQQIPLQASSADTLGLEYNGYLKTNITLPPRKSPEDRYIKDKYVTICSQSTTQAKYWNYGWDYKKYWETPDSDHLHHADGWHEVIKYLDTIGYKVVILNQYIQYGSGGDYGVPIEDLKDAIPGKRYEQLHIYNRHDFSHHPNVIDKTNEFININDRIEDLMYADFHIGLNSGLSWVAKTVGTPIVMIPGLHPPDIIPIADKYVTQDDPNVCTNCALEYPFVRGDWGNCPKHQRTEREFECTSTITPDMVIDKIKELVHDLDKSRFTEKDFQREADSLNDKNGHFISRMRFDNYMIGSYLSKGMLIGMFEEDKIISKKSNPSLKGVSKRLGKKIHNDIFHFSKLDTWNEESNRIKEFLHEYESITEKHNAIVTKFSTKSTDNIYTPKQALEALWNRDIDMLIMGEWLYYPKAGDFTIGTFGESGGEYKTLYHHEMESLSHDNSKVFSNLYEIENELGTPCGVGSVLHWAEHFGTISGIQNIIKKYNIKSVNMIGCGIFGNWEYKVGYKELGVDYRGYELVQAEVDRNKREFPEYDFEQFDMTRDVCRPADLIITRQVIQHLNSKEVISTIDNFRKSGSKFLLISQWDIEHNYEMFPNDFRVGFSLYNPKNLLKYPYNITDKFLENNIDYRAEGPWNGPTLPLHAIGKTEEELEELIDSNYPVETLSLCELNKIVVHSLEEEKIK